MTQPQLLEREVQRFYLPSKYGDAVTLAPSSSSLANSATQMAYLTVGAWASGARAWTRTLPSRREKETQWRQTHLDVLRHHVGRWVVIQGDQLVASSVSLGEAVALARANGVAVPYVFQVEEDGEDFARIGL